MPYSRSQVMVLNYNLVVAHPRSQSHTTMINTLCTVFIGNCCVSSLNSLKGSIIFFILASSYTTHSKSYANRSWKQSSGSDYSVTENNYHVKLTACRGNHSKYTAAFCCCCFFLKLLNWNVIFALFSLLLLAWLKSTPASFPRSSCLGQTVLESDSRTGPGSMLLFVFWSVPVVLWSTFIVAQMWSRHRALQASDNSMKATSLRNKKNQNSFEGMAVAFFCQCQSKKDNYCHVLILVVPDQYKILSSMELVLSID